MSFKKIISVGVLTAILLQGMVALIVWQVQIHLLHKQNWNNLELQHASEMKLTFEDFKKAKVNSHEIRIDNKMFDIKSLNITEEGVTLMLVADEDENFLQEKIIQHFAERLPNTKANGFNNLPILFTLNYFQKHSDFLFYNSKNFTQLIFSNNCVPTKVYSTIHTPPPDFRPIS